MRDIAFVICAQINHKAMAPEVMAEFKLSSLPIVYNMSFGHIELMCVLPYGAMAEIDCRNRTYFILESGVV